MSCISSPILASARTSRYGTVVKLTGRTSSTGLTDDLLDWLSRAAGPNFTWTFSKYDRCRVSWPSSCSPWVGSARSQRPAGPFQPRPRPREALQARNA